MQRPAPLSESDIRPMISGETFVKGPDGDVLGVGLIGLFLFRDGATREKRKAVATVAHEYLQRFGDKMAWRTAEGEAIDLRKKLAPAIDDSPRFERLRSFWSTEFSSGNSVAECSAYTLGFLCLPAWHPVGVSHLEFSVPLSHLGSELVLCFQRWAGLLKAEQAYAGVGILLPLGQSNAAPYGHLGYALASRYPGLEMFSPSTAWESLTLTDSLRCVNWLTAVGDKYLERLGGWERVAAGLDKDVGVYRYDGGVIFQAGNKPEMGDAERGRVPELYRQVARALKPVRFSGVPSHFFWPTEAGPTFDAENVAKWLARFD